MTTRKLHHKAVTDTATAHVGHPGDIWFDPASTVLRTYNGSPGGKSIGGGTPGPQGTPGTNGATGTTGPQGPTGTPGNDGATGPQGTPGNDGTPGPQGATGPQGPTGTPGTNGTSITGTDVTTALGFTPVSAAVQVFSSAIITISTTNAYNLSTTASYNILNVTVGGLTATLNMPTSPVNGQVATIAVIKNTVTLAVGTGTVNPGFEGGWVLGTTFTYIYVSADSTWYRVA